MTVKPVIVPENKGLCYFPKNEPWNAHRPVKVIITGAGIGGTTSAVLLSKKVHNLTIAVYDRLEKIGGTWAANVYPGVRCDVPSHAYQLSFEPNTNWSEYYPKGAEIQSYYEGVVAKYGLTPNFHLRHEVLRAVWLPSLSQWEVTIQNLNTGETFTDRADFLLSSQGRISVPKWPSFPGLHDTFKGRVIHSARWPRDFDHAGKRLAVIGNGASGQQLVPNLVRAASHIDHYVRSKTWVTPTFAGDLFVATADRPGGPEYTPEQRERFAKDEDAYLEHRRAFYVQLHVRHPGADILGSQANQNLRERIRKAMLDRLDGDQDWLERVVPEYSPGCKRLTPAPGYLEALKGPKVDYVTNKIVRVDEEGIVTEDGSRRSVDAIVAATGFDTGFVSRFPLIGRDGVDLKEKWAADGEIGFPETYFGVMAPGFPNYFTVLQAQGNARGGTVPLHVETAVTYIAKCIRKVQSQSYAALEPREDATRDFNDIVNGHFTNKVTADSCNSYFKQGAGNTRNVIAWPGTYHHRADALKDPRWEDFTFERRRDARLNRFEYFSDGTTVREGGADAETLTRYLKRIGDIDVALVHEAWNE